MEDAALVRPDDGSPFALSVDFITPIVDDPETFGAIAAANSLSDIYAMGGEPQVALAICGFPEGDVPSDVLVRIFRGGRNKAAEAGCAIVGGHTVIDPELKYGLCVVGSVGTANLSHKGTRVGDRLVLTKPIGTGIAAQAIKSRRLSDAELARVVAVMTRLNRDAKDAALAARASAATDVTGFGLLGHLHHLLLGGGVAARVYADAVPVLEFARRLASEDIVPGGTKRNLAYVESRASFSRDLPESERLVLCDAQTSGGLLISVPHERESELVRGLSERESLAAAVIGEVTEGPAGSIEVVAGGMR